MVNKGGAPKGNTNARNGFMAKQALVIALDKWGQDHEVVERMKTLVEIWNAQIKKAMEGDTPAATMIVDRLDGKPKQAIVGGDEDEPIQVIHKIELVPLGSSSSDT